MPRGKATEKPFLKKGESKFLLNYVPALGIYIAKDEAGKVVTIDRDDLEGRKDVVWEVPTKASAKNETLKKFKEHFKIGVGNRLVNSPKEEEQADWVEARKNLELALAGGNKFWSEGQKERVQAVITEMKEGEKYLTHRTKLGLDWSSLYGKTDPRKPSPLKGKPRGSAQ